MKQRKALAALLPLIFAALCACAQTPLRWAFEASRPVSPTWEVYRGESVSLEPSILEGGTPAEYPTNAVATLWYQTNGMSSAWWSAPATVASNRIAAAWTAALDGGAPQYRFFISVVSEDSAISYRANGTLKMLESPGAVPNAIELPRRSLDLAAIDILNAPWATPADVAAATGGISVAESDPVAAAWQTNHLATVNPHGLTPGAIGALPGVVDDGGKAVVGYDIQRGSVDMLADRIRVRSGGTWVDYGINGLLKMAPMQSWWVGFDGAGYYNALDESGWSVTWSDMVLRGEFVETNALFQAELEDKLDADDMPALGYASSNWVEQIRGLHQDVATNVSWRVVVSNGHWLVRSVEL